MSNYMLSESPRSCYSSSEHSSVSAELKLYQALLFSVPVFFIFIILFLFYFFYLKRRRVDWSSLRMRSTSHHGTNDISKAELGLKKEVREMLPVIIYKESFSVRDTQCSVCLGDYEAEEKLQQIPACGHTFHEECIDHWLAKHTTCPLCRLSLVASAKASAPTSDVPLESSDVPVETPDEPNTAADTETSLQNSSQTIGAAQSNGNGRMLENDTEEEESRAHGSEHKDTGTGTDGQGHSADCAESNGAVRSATYSSK